MPRDFHINGPALVKVFFGEHVSTSGTLFQELGLTEGQINVVPHFFHKDIYVDDFGPNCPPEVMWQLASVDINMTMIHFDKETLRICVNESMAGSSDGTLVGAGNTLGHGLPLFSSGNHLIDLTITSPDEQEPYHFFATYLLGPPYKYPMGTEVTIVDMTWRAIPYKPFLVLNNSSGQPIGPEVGFQELTSEGVVLWNRTTVE